ncbi:MAG: hypothetical protein ACI8QC_000120 [Planctomycetota bacterium]|jgi:hypothetical protein
MRKHLLTLLALASLTPLNLWTPDAAAAPLVQEEEKGTFTNKKYGFTVKPPKGWDMVPLETDQVWMTCKYRSKKSYFFHDKTRGYTFEHQPELKVIALVKANLDAKRKADREEGEDGDVITISGGAPFKDYEGYLESVMSAGFFVDTQETETIAGTEVDIYSYRVEKLEAAPRFIRTWIWRTEDIDYAVQIDVLQSEDKKLKKILERTFKSFELIERSGADLSNKGWVTLSAMNASSPKERRAARIKSESALRQRVLDSLSSEWTTTEFGDLLVLSATDKRYTKKIGNHAKSVQKWLDDTFPYVGEGEYARHPIIRVLDGQEALRNFGSGAGDSNQGAYIFRKGLEIYTAKTSGGWTGIEIDNLNRGMAMIWFEDKDRDLNSALPFWIRDGLNHVIRGARGDGKKIKFRLDYDVVEARTYIAQGFGMDVKEMLLLTRADVSASTSAESKVAQQRLTQVFSFFRYLISKEAKKNKLTKNFLKTYVATLQEVVDDQTASDKEKYSDLGEPETEEEEEERAKARSERSQQRAGKTATEVLDRGFGDWPQEDWDKLLKAYRDWL